MKVGKLSSMNSFVGDAGGFELDARVDGKPAELFQEGRQVGGFAVVTAGDNPGDSILCMLKACDVLR